MTRTEDVTPEILEKPWTEDEITLLLALRREGHTVYLIADYLGRHWYDIYVKWMHYEPYINFLDTIDNRVLG